MKQGRDLNRYAAADVYMDRKYDEIQMACNINQWDLYKTNYIS